MKLQAVLFKRTEGSKWETGFAILECYGVSSIQNILTQDGELLGEKGPWDYHLFNDEPGHLAEVKPSYRGEKS